MYLFDTVALSESMKRKPNPGFLAWRTHLSPADVYTSVLCLGELERGIRMLGKSERQAGLDAWLAELRARMGTRLLDVGADVAAAWGRLGLRGKSEPIDALIGATAAVHRLAVVTRNTRHFDGLGVPVVNPWT
jgi:toxin FitB